MTWIYLIVLAFGYLVLGSVIGSLIGFDDDSRMVVTVFWPAVVLMLIIGYTLTWFNILGDNIVDFLRGKVFEPIGEQLSIWFSKEEP